MEMEDLGDSSATVRPEHGAEHMRRNAIEQAEKIVAWYLQMFEKAATFASILASVMFSAMILDLDTSKIPNGNEHEVRTWAAAGAALFVILVLLCTGSTLALLSRRENVMMGLANEDWRIGYFSVVVLFVFQGLLLSGVFFFCLVVTAYAPAVGWTALGCTSLSAMVAFDFTIEGLTVEILRQRRKRRERE